MTNLELHRCIVAAGLEAGLYLHEAEKLRGEDAEIRPDSLLTLPIIFTMRPIEEYMRNYRGSWTNMKLDALVIGEPDEKDPDLDLFFEVRFNLAYTEGGDAADPTILIDEVLERIEDFARSYPDEALALFHSPIDWEMNIAGEIIYELEEKQPPILDFGMYISLRLGVRVFTADASIFDNQLSVIGTDSQVGQAIQDRVNALVLLFRWLEMEAPPHPPLLDLLEIE